MDVTKLEHFVAECRKGFADGRREVAFVLEGAEVPAWIQRGLQRMSDLVDKVEGIASFGRRVEDVGVEGALFDDELRGASDGFPWHHVKDMQGRDAYFPDPSDPSREIRHSVEKLSIKMASRLVPPADGWHLVSVELIGDDAAAGLFVDDRGRFQQRGYGSAAGALSLHDRPIRVVVPDDSPPAPEPAAPKKKCPWRAVLRDLAVCAAAGLLGAATQRTLSSAVGFAGPAARRGPV
jgi:hypothetical protein